MILYKEEIDSMSTSMDAEVYRLSCRRKDIKEEMRSLSFNVEKSINELKDKINVTVDENRKIQSKLKDKNLTTRIIARIRPPVGRDRGDDISLSAPADNQIEAVKKTRSLTKKAPALLAKQFRVHVALDLSATEDDVFDEVSESIEHALSGGRTCLIAYGQPKSGKTYTMRSIMANAIYMMTSKFVVYGEYPKVQLSYLEVRPDSTFNLLPEHNMELTWDESKILE